MNIVGSFIFYQDKFPILLRHSHKSSGGKWGLPAGKVELGESDIDAIVREIEEETGFKPNKKQVKKVRQDTFGDGDNTYTFTTFYINIDKEIEIKIEEAAHADYKWVSARECYEIPNLVPDLHDLLQRLKLVK